MRGRNDAYYNHDTGADDFEITDRCCMKTLLKVRVIMPYSIETNPHQM